VAGAVGSVDHAPGRLARLSLPPLDPDQLTDTLAAVDLDVTTELKATLDDISHEYRYGDAAR
jgi:hypothetical protein